MRADGKPGGAAVARGVARGIVAAMAMTGMRKVTTGLGLVARTPPVEIARHGVPGLFAQVPRERRSEALELAHWGYGATAGILFGALPERVRRSAWAGPAYGLATWAFFETLIARALALPPRAERPLTERVAIAADHLLYGVVVGGEARARR